MRADRCRWWVGVGVAAALVLAGCGDGGGEGDPAADRSGPSSTAVTTTPTTSPTITAPPTTVAGEPMVTAAPSRGPAGTRVRIEGDGFTGDPWQTGGGDLWLTEAAGQGACDMVAEVEHDVQLTAAGHLEGSFVVPATATCRFSAGNEINTGPLRYDIAYQCTACAIGSFTVILEGESMEEPMGESCDATVAFGVQNVAIDIVEDGLTCEAAESFVRDHARPWRPLDSPIHIDADGFSCDRTGLSDAALPPRANYKCVNGTQVIFFIRT